MKKNFLIFLLLFFNFSYCDQIPIILEYAKTKEELLFGLMGRKSLNENAGMLFIYPKKEFVKIWMFNCFIDLSVAFLNEEGVIQEIQALKAFPEKMVGLPLMKNLQEIKNAKIDPHVLRFFEEKSVTSSIKTNYALEMNGDWFYNHHVKVGDSLIFDQNQKNAYILRKDITTK